MATQPSTNERLAAIEAKLTLILQRQVSAEQRVIQVTSYLRTYLKWSLDIMGKLEDLEAAVAAANAASAADRANATELRAKVETGVEAIQGLVALVQSLRDELAAGNAVTDERLQALIDQANTITANLAGSSADEEAAETAITGAADQAAGAANPPAPAPAP